MQNGQYKGLNSADKSTEEGKQKLQDSVYKKVQDPSTVAYKQQLELFTKTTKSHHVGSAITPYKPKTSTYMFIYTKSSLN